MFYNHINTMDGLTPRIYNESRTLSFTLLVGLREL